MTMEREELSRGIMLKTQLHRTLSRSVTKMWRKRTNLMARNRAFLVNEKTSRESEKAFRRKTALTFDTASKKGGRKKKTSKVQDKELNEDKSESDELGGPGEILRRKTARRKESVKELPEAEEETSSDGSWRAVQTHLESALGRGKRKEPDERERGSGSPRSGRMRLPSATSHTSRGSLVSNRRAADFFQNAPPRYKNVHIADLPSCARQTFPREVDPPLSLKYGPTQMPTAKHRDDMGHGADWLSTLHGGKPG